MYLMNRFLLIFLIVHQSCGLKNENNTLYAFYVSINNTTQLIQLENKVDCNPISKKILGIWCSTDTSAPSAAFKIDKNRIFYVDAFKYCSYKIKSDTLEIKYEKNYSLTYKVKFKEDDTLILEGDNIDTFHKGKITHTHIS